MSKKNTNKTNNRNHQYSLVVYEKSDLNKLLKYNVKRYAYIYHNKDKNEDGTDKEPHFHLFLSFNSPRRQLWLDTFKAFTKTKGNIMCEPCRDVDNLILYFLHKKHPEKHQYKQSAIKANFDYKLAGYECDKDKQLLDMLENIADNQGIGWRLLYRSNPKLIYSAGNLQKVVNSLIDEDIKILTIHQKQKYEQMDKERRQLLADKNGKQIDMIPISDKDLPF